MSDLPARPRPVQVNVNIGREPGEVVHFDRDGVTVTSDRVICDGSVYPVRGITKVEAEVETVGGGRWFLSALIAAPLVFLSTLFAFSHDYLVTTGFVLAAAVAVALVFVLRRPRTRFNVVIRTAGGQGEVISTPNEAVADEIASAIDAAIVNYRP